ncbi:MAG: intradiol ring-cleavage dioxygenase [Actinomycetota bacterium]|nr:intradiol ring-cleavage dioxygenase [Actinomycetota bacterium]
MDNARITRRGSLIRLGGLAAAALGAGAWKAAADADGAGPAAVASDEVTCVLAPEQTEGPYYVPRAKVRRDVTEGKRGTVLMLQLKVVDASSCKAIKGASVDIWHCDAAGVYSGVGSAQAATFLRGIQKTDARGVATFKTIYPGYYPGRTVHIHVKVHLGGNVVHTGQLYFPDATTDRVYKAAPYSSRPPRATRNTGDSIYRNGDKRSQVVVRKRSGAPGYLGTIAMGVHRS